jgi:hypothetical protein
LAWRSGGRNMDQNEFENTFATIMEIGDFGMLKAFCRENNENVLPMLEDHPQLSLKLLKNIGEIKV